MNPETALNTVLVGIATIVAQNLVATQEWFGKDQIRAFLKVRQDFHGEFLVACLIVADLLEEDGHSQTATQLRQIGGLNPKQVGRALNLASKAFLNIRKTDLRGFDRKTQLLTRSLWDFIRLFDGEEIREDWDRAKDFIRSILDIAIKVPECPPKLRTLFRRVQRNLGRFEDSNVMGDTEPGRWFELPEEDQADIRSRADTLTAQRDALSFKELGADVYQARYRALQQQLMQVQLEAGVNLGVIQKEAEVPLDVILRREAKLDRDGPTEYVITQFEKEMIANWERFPGQRGRLTKQELRKIRTLLKKAKTLGTVDRILNEAKDRGILRKVDMENFPILKERASKNKAVRDGVPMAPLKFTPMRVEEFQAQFKAGRVEFRGEWEDEAKEEVLGRLGAAVATLEGIFGEGFCGNHAKRLDFRFEDGSGTGSGARASYFGWENRNLWQPRVSFGNDFDGVLAHELSHYYEDLLAYKLSPMMGKDTDGHEYGDVKHGLGDIFGRGGMSVESWLGFYAEPSEGSTIDKLNKEIPEFVDLMKEIAKTEDYARWADKVGVWYENSLMLAIKEVTGAEDYDTYFKLINLRYKSEVPPEILAAAKRIYNRMSGGDDRNLTYYHSTSEVWARMMEQYVYTKLSESGIANPWLTQLTYDTDVMDQMMEEDTFIENIVPIMDRIFAKLRKRNLIARLASRFLSRIRF